MIIYQIMTVPPPGPRRASLDTSGNKSLGNILKVIDGDGSGCFIPLSVCSGDREEPSFSLLRTGQIFSDNDEDTPDNSHNLTRSPIRRSATSSKSTHLNNTPRVTSSSGGPRPTGRRAGSSKRTTGRPQRRPVSAAAVEEKPQGTSDPEPEKEVAEERDGRHTTCCRNFLTLVLLFFTPVQDLKTSH